MFTCLPVQAQDLTDSADASPLPLATESDNPPAEDVTPDDAPAEASPYPEDFSDPNTDSPRPVTYSAFGEDDSDPRIEWGGEPQVSE